MSSSYFQIAWTHLNEEESHTGWKMLDLHLNGPIWAMQYAPLSDRPGAAPVQQPELTSSVFGRRRRRRHAAAPLLERASVACSVGWWRVPGLD